MVKFCINPVYTKIPTTITIEMFDEFFLPSLSTGHKHQKGEKVLAITDRKGFVISPFISAPVNKNDCILLPDIQKLLTYILFEDFQSNYLFYTFSEVIHKLDVFFGFITCNQLNYNQYL